ncbi:4-hydroxy-3-methylbut-2-enyl diphosphate reductase [Sphingomonas sp. ASY06-1R]|jgi:4-hydroxy-3-methylbut-2-enyl diphosphate reductase|uniref:4-hydroxy-3-methylbut-2-enyl diphosphate reductase n=1 Tax=Sphingomonas sp. ASY06-1R TaxID=3445771 RepID=UPI003FA282D6
MSQQRLHVVLAKPRGFCAGVRRAIDIVERSLERASAPVFVRHEIVHNRHVVDRLRAKGATFVQELSEVPDDAVTIFSAHGVPRSVEEEARARRLPVIDATCPLVAKVHFQARHYSRAGRIVVLIGHAGHAEVEGTLGQIDAKIHLVSTVADVAALPLHKNAPVAYVTQTTLSVEDTRDIIAALTARFVNLVGPQISDVCYATQNRQNAVRDLARISDLLIVVGAANSSNSNRLREIGTDTGVPSYLIDDGDGLDPAWLDGVTTIGLTAGASAPDDLIDGVIAAIRQWRAVSVSELDGVEETLEFNLPPIVRSGARAVSATA